MHIVEKCLFSPGIFTPFVAARLCSSRDFASFSSVNRKSEYVCKPIWKELLKEDQDSRRKIIDCYDTIISHVTINNARIVYFQMKRCVNHLESNINEFRLKCLKRRRCSIGYRHVGNRYFSTDIGGVNRLRVDKLEIVFEAIQKECTAFLSVLIAAGFDRNIKTSFYQVNVVDDNDGTALTCAVWCGHAQMIRALVLAGANCSDFNVELFHGDTSLLVKIILELAKINLDARDKHSCTHAAESGNSAQIEARSADAKRKCLSSHFTKKNLLTRGA